MPTLKVSADSPTAATIFRAAAAVETSSATMSRWRGSSGRKSWLRWLTPPFGMLGRVAGIPVSVETLREFRQRGMIIGECLVSVFQVAGVDQIQPYALQAALPEFQGLSGAIGQVDDPTGNDRSAVVDPDYDGPAIVQVRDPHVASHGKCQVSGRHVVHIVGLAASGRLTVENLAVPGGGPNLKRFGLDLFADLGRLLN